MAASLTTKADHNGIRHESFPADMREASSQVGDSLRLSGRILQAGVMPTPPRTE